jgi:hypothetical protein
MFHMLDEYPLDRFVKITTSGAVPLAGDAVKFAIGGSKVAVDVALGIGVSVAVAVAVAGTLVNDAVTVAVGG